MLNIAESSLAILREFNAMMRWANNEWKLSVFKMFGIVTVALSWQFLPNLWFEMALMIPLIVGTVNFKSNSELKRSWKELSNFCDEAGKPFFKWTIGFYTYAINVIGIYVGPVMLLTIALFAVVSNFADPSYILVNADFSIARWIYDIGRQLSEWVIS